MNKQEFERLVIELGNAAFDCGAWDGDNADDYTPLLAAWNDARDAVLAAWTHRPAVAEPAAPATPTRA